jgi:hypothetical protein
MLAEMFTQHESRDIIAQLILFSLVIIFTVSFLVGVFNKNAKPLNISNKFDLGYIDDVKPQAVARPSVATKDDELESLKKQIEIARLRKQLSSLQNSSKPITKKVNPLLDDCCSALVSFGVPKRKARAEAEIILQSSPSIKTVQEFITEYGKR